MYPYRLSVAPMLHRTDKHCRYFYRLLSKHTLLYSEMITTNAILNGDKKKLLDFNKEEHPISAQLAGSNPKDMAKCAKIIEDWGYDEININVGCPSDRIQNANFGACLMNTPDIVGQCVQEMLSAVKIPITVKSRIGIDNNDSYENLYKFIDTIYSYGCDTFIIHARKAWLQGLSPKQNREVPKLNYEFVYQIKKDFPNLNIAINGGVDNLDKTYMFLKEFDSVMIGRAIYRNPYILAYADNNIFNKNYNIATRLEILVNYLIYIEKQISLGVSIRKMTRHIMGLYFAQSGAKKFKRVLSSSSLTLNDIYNWIYFAK